MYCDHYGTEWPGKEITLTSVLKSKNQRSLGRRNSKRTARTGKV